MYLQFYNGEHSVKFDDMDSWNDWHLIPSAKMVMPPPKMKQHYVNLPGTHGSIDLSTALTGYPTYENRTGSMQFILSPEYNWQQYFSKITNYLHGRVCKLVLKDDRSYFYEGRCTVDQLGSDGKLNAVVIGFNVSPYKQEIQDSSEQWLWDPFNFYTGVIRTSRNMAVNGSLTVKCPPTYQPAFPKFTCSSAMTVKHTGYMSDGTRVNDTYSLPAGTSVPGMMFYDYESTLVFTGNGTVTISYRGGSL